MTKKELIQTAKTYSGLDAQTMERALNGLLEKIGCELANGRQVVLKGFGKFETVERAARPGRNPKTGEAIRIPASRSVKFTPGKDLKNTVNHVVK